MSEVRVRFAPSPTGSFHVGSARTALFNWLFARKHRGVFVLRIEDTDRERNTKESLEGLLEGMRWLGLDWDEGPEIGGDFGPYFQSQRSGCYRETLEKLKQAGRTYEKDGAVWFRLEGERSTVVDSHLGREVERVKAAPQIIDDMIRGRVERSEDRDFVLQRSDGQPVFHLVNVADDLAMGITHVIRGEDHLSNTSKHCELFRALGKPPPRFAHIPLILKANGKGKMSKRDQGAVIENYRESRFLPQAVVNYLALLGWSPKDDREMFTLGELVEAFDLSGISSSNAKFDHEKLAHLNTLHLKALTSDEFARVARASLAPESVNAMEPAYLEAVFGLLQPKTSRLDDLEELAGPLLKDPERWDDAILTKVAKKGDPVKMVTELKNTFEEITTQEWRESKLVEAVDSLAAGRERKSFDYFPVLRFALSNRTGGPDLIPMVNVLGRERTLRRLNAFLREKTT